MSRKYNLRVEGESIATPSSVTINIQDISSADSGRTLDGLMHKNKIGSKRTIEFGWNNLRPTDVEKILHAFRSREYFAVTYWDPENASTQLTKTFYLGDVSIPVKSWFVGGEIYSQLSFTIIER